jgi:hypothetical protein
MLPVSTVCKWASCCRRTECSSGSRWGEGSSYLGQSPDWLGVVVPDLVGTMDPIPRANNLHQQWGAAENLQHNSQWSNILKPKLHNFW